MPKQIHVVLILLLAVVLNSCRSASSNTVVVYVSEDQVFSEPILKDFERETGITVKSVFDTEESKSTGVTNRLIAEKDNPQADVYWANEPVRADALKQRGVSTPYVSASAEGIADQFKDPDHYWTGFSARARLLLVNARSTIKPESVMAYTDPSANGRAAIANPLFGTTTDYVADSDDAVNRKKQGKPVEIVYPDQDPNGLGVLILPNAVALIKGSPHAENGKQLIDYLLSKSTERKLAFADCAQIPLHSGVETPPEVRRIEDIKPMRVGYADLARKMDEIQPFLKEWAGQ